MRDSGQAERLRHLELKRDRKIMRSLMSGREAQVKNSIDYLIAVLNYLDQL